MEGGIDEKLIRAPLTKRIIPVPRPAGKPDQLDRPDHFGVPVSEREGCVAAQAVNVGVAFQIGQHHPAVQPFPPLGVKVSMVQQLIAAEIDYMLSLLRPMQAMYGEAGGVATARFGEALALSMQANADPAFNRVLGFGDSELPLLDDILDWYTQHRAICRFDILSYTTSPLLLKCLTERGFVSQPLETFLSTSPRPYAPPVKGWPEVRELAGEGLEEFASAFLAVYPQPTVEEAVRTCLKAQYGQPEWHCYLASVVGTVAAFGAMYINNGSAALISAATLPQFRRRGCQTALLARRRADARGLGCDLVWSHAACGSSSQRNMERQGLHPVAIKYRYERPASLF